MFWFVIIYIVCCVAFSGRHRYFSPYPIRWRIFRHYGRLALLGHSVKMRWKFKMDIVVKTNHSRNATPLRLVHPLKTQTGCPQSEGGRGVESACGELGYQSGCKFSGKLDIGGELRRCECCPCGVSDCTLKWSVCRKGNTVHLKPNNRNRKSSGKARFALKLNIVHEFIIFACCLFFFCIFLFPILYQDLSLMMFTAPYNTSNRGGDCLYWLYRTRYVWKC